MNNVTILKKGENLILWIYKNFTNKFTGIFHIFKDRFPVLEKYPLLKYSIIPLLIGAFFLLRYIIKLGLNELASWSSVYLDETSGFNVSERVIVLSVAVVFIALRVGLKIRNQRKNKTN